MIEPAGTATPDASRPVPATPIPGEQAHAARGFGGGRRDKKARTFWGYVFILPGIIGLMLFFFGPMLFSLGVSFTEWDIITPARFAGAENYVRFAEDPLVHKSLAVTFYFVVLNVPAVVFISLLVASMLNTNIRGRSVYRTIFYIPSIVPAVANAALWMFLYNPMFGLLNRVIGIFGIPPQGWIYSDTQVIPSLVVMSVWAAGNTVVIYLAGLQGISRQLYEAIEIDGGGVFRKFFHITVPMMTPLIFYNAVLTTIYSLQTFTQAFIMTEGGPKNASLFYMLLLYRTAFRHQSMGYASAMAWVMLLIIGVLTVIAFRTSGLWVYYGGASRDE